MSKLLLLRSDMLMGITSKMNWVLHLLTSTELLTI